MNTAKRVVAAGQVLLILPAVLFLGAVRQMQLPEHELALTAQRIVTWYAARLWTLWVLLIAMPLTVLVAGCLTLLSEWQMSKVVAAPTLMAGGVLAIVVVHMLAN